MQSTISENSVLDFLKGSLLGFSAAMFPEYRPGRHHKLLSSRLEEIESGRLKRLIVTMPPRHGKSKLTSELFPSWALGRNPKRRILALSYGQDLSDGFGRSVRNYLKSSTFVGLFPDCRLASDSNSVRRFNTTQSGGYVGVGVGGPVTGRGADILVLDDVTKNRQEADSPLVRDTLLDWFRSVARTRLEPNGAIIVCQTRWGTNDFIAWLLSETAHENWETINLPAIALEDDPLGRKPGEALWPERFPIPVLKEVETTLGSRDWESLYQQCPLSDADVIFQSKWLQFYQYPPDARDGIVVHSWDLSFGGTTSNSSWVVGQVWLVIGTGLEKRKYLLFMRREQLGFSDTLTAIRTLDEQYPADEILIEDKANGPAVIECLKHEFGYPLKPINPGASSKRMSEK